MQYPYLLTEDTLTVFIDHQEYATSRTAPAWEQIKEQIKQEFVQKDVLIALLKPITAVIAAVQDDRDLTVRNGFVFWGDDKIHDSLSKRLLDVMSEQFPIEPWKLFVRNLFANPEKFAQQELYDWLESADLPITSDGSFLAYKIVDSNYKDLYTHTFDNSVGKTVEVARESVDPVRTNTCSRGLHFCSKGYLGHYGTSSGSRVMIVKVNPADVVSIPVDYNYAKGRTWKYEVVGEVDYAIAADILWRAVDDYDSWDSDEDDDYPEDDYSWDDCGDPTCEWCN